MFLLLGMIVGPVALGEGEAAKKLLQENHEFTMNIWTQVVGKKPLKYAAIAAEKKASYVGVWMGRWHEPTSRLRVGADFTLKADGTWESKGVRLDEDDERFDLKGRWYLHKGAIQLWDGPASEEAEGAGFLFVQEKELYMLSVQSKEGRVKLVRKKEAKKK